MLMKCDAVINMRARSSDLDLLDQAASVRGVSRSAFIRESAETEARKVLSTPRLVSSTADRGGVMHIPTTHNEFAASLAAHLRSKRCDHRVTWENLEFSDWSVPQDGFRCRPDVFSIFPTLDPLKCRPWTHEVKISRADFQSDIRSGKWRTYMRFSCRVFFAAPKGLIALTELPPEAGLWEFDPERPMGDKYGYWAMAKPAKFCKGWELQPRHLMKLILGRWGTFAGNLPVEQKLSA